MVQGLIIDGVWVSNPNEVKMAFLNFYNEKFQAQDSSLSFSPMTATSVLDDSDHFFLEDMVTTDEIRAAVWACGSNKASDSDGLSFHFLKKYWKLISYDVTKANRLSKVVDKIVSHEQWAFISVRQILDGPLMLSEVIEWNKKRNEKLMIFKVDFEKANDSVCLQSARTSILVNGSPSSKISIKRGLRQGDPLSPFLFILVIEGLHLTLKDALQSNLIHGAKPRVNIHKSNVYGIGVSSEEVSDMDRVTGCASGIIPFIYLGLPIGSNMNRTANWNKLVDLFGSKLSAWKASLLSNRGILWKLILFFLDLKFIVPLSNLITALAVVKNGIPKMKGLFSSSFISKIMKSTRRMKAHLDRMTWFSKKRDNEMMMAFTMRDIISLRKKMLNLEEAKGPESRSRLDLILFLLWYKMNQLLIEKRKSSRIDDEVFQGQRQQNDNYLQDERQDQPKEEEVKPRRSKRARTEKSVGPSFVNFMVENEPTSYREAVTSLEWLSYKWIFKKKMKDDGTIDKYKARLVIKGFRQHEGLYYFDTYSPVMRITSIRMVLAIVALRNLEVYQMDVKLEFLSRDLYEEIYMNKQEDFIALRLEIKVCRLVKSLYGLRKAPKQGHQISPYH
nr:calcineurin B-like protein 4 [Tanacetum cinerariifolium]